MIFIRRGFTLIELLVVIAIIGVLAAIIIVAVGSARQNASDTSVRTGLHQILNQAALYYSDHDNTYGQYDDGAGGSGPCPIGGGSNSVYDDEIVSRVLTDALALVPGQNAICYASATQYAVAVPRPQDGDNPAPTAFWCIDSANTFCGNNGANNDMATPIVDGACVPCVSND